MYIKADSGNYVARLFYILYGGRHLRPQGGHCMGQVPPSPGGRKLGVDLE